MSNEVVESLSARESRSYDNILSSNVLTYLKNIKRVSPIKAQAERLMITALDQGRNEEILKLFYSNILNSNIKCPDYLFSLKGDINKKFNDINSLLNK